MEREDLEVWRLFFNVLISFWRVVRVAVKWAFVIFEVLRFLESLLASLFVEAERWEVGWEERARLLREKASLSVSVSEG